MQFRITLRVKAMALKKEAKSPSFKILSSPTLYLKINKNICKTHAQKDFNF